MTEVMRQRDKSISACVPFVPKHNSRYGPLMFSLAASMVNDLNNPSKNKIKTKPLLCNTLKKDCPSKTGASLKPNSPSPKLEMCPKVPKNKGENSRILGPNKLSFATPPKPELKDPHFRNPDLVQLIETFPNLSELKTNGLKAKSCRTVIYALNSEINKTGDRSNNSRKLNHYVLQRSHGCKLIIDSLETQLKDNENAKKNEIDCVKSSHAEMLTRVEANHKTVLKAKENESNSWKQKYLNLRNHHTSVKIANRRNIQALDNKENSLIQELARVNNILDAKNTDIDSLKADKEHQIKKLGELELLKLAQIEQFKRSFDSDLSQIRETHSNAILEKIVKIDTLKLDWQIQKRNNQLLILERDSLKRHINTLEKNERCVKEDFANLNAIIQDKNTEIRGLNLQIMELREKIENLSSVKKKSELLKQEIEHQKFVIERKNEYVKLMSVERSRLLKELHWCKRCFAEDKSILDTNRFCNSRSWPSLPKFTSCLHKTSYTQAPDYLM
ncbi:myosin heavy chain, striated muscle-like isoform X2 [Gordionus sp. m RMFG-2023]|uniref:myosin heavy chain, striated muscle-like isoform X2 n=1 Tax=Gordionus sp. m RMFG-2023 TaxID=3053472 RepID=UPI0031FC3F8F